MNYLEQATKFAKKAGLGQLSRASVCKYLGIETGSFRHHVGMSYGEFVDSVADQLPLGTQLPPGTTRTSATLRRRQVLGCAVELSKQVGYARFTRDQLAEAVGTTVGNLARSYTMAELREAVVRYAVEHDVPEIVEQARANGDPLVN